MQFEGEFWGKRLSSKSRGWGNKVEIQLGGNPGQSKCAEMSFDPLSHDFSTLSDRLYQPNGAKKFLKLHLNFYSYEFMPFLLCTVLIKSPVTSEIFLSIKGELLKVQN